MSEKRIKNFSASWIPQSVAKRREARMGRTLEVFLLFAVFFGRGRGQVYDYVQGNEAHGETLDGSPGSRATASNNRIEFLEWLFGMISEPEEDTSPPEPINQDACAPCACGTANKKIRIIGGKPTQVNQYPWMALLMYNKRFYCGGSLINSKYVLTAAHCVDGFSKQKMTVRLMEHDRNADSESAVIDRKVSRIIRHSGYNDRTFNNDIALLRLDEDVLIAGDVRPVCLPQRGRSFTNEEGLVTGWGVTAPGGPTNSVLHEVKVPIMSNADCKKSKYGSRKITDNMLCAGYPEGKKDACQGDSGGPLHVINGTIHSVVGVVSWGEGCARPDYPGVYSRVNRYITWITKNTVDACPCSLEQKRT